MPLSGSGVYSPPSPYYPAITDELILASDYNAILVDIATALSTCIMKDGQQIVTANIPFAGFKLTGVGTGTANQDVTNVLQVFTSPTFSDVTMTGTATDIDSTNITIDAVTALDLTATTTTIAGTTLDVNATNTDLTGSNVTLQTQTLGDNTTKGATTAFVFAGLALKANLASPALTGVPTAPTASLGTNTTQIATMAALQAQALSTAVPVIGADAQKTLSNNGTIISWQDFWNTTVNDLADGSDTSKRVALDLSGISTSTTRTVTVPNSNFTITGNDLTQTLENKTIVLPVLTLEDSTFTIQDTHNSSRKIDYDLGGLSAVTRTATPADNDIDWDTPGLKLLEVGSGTADASFDVEWTNGTYNEFWIKVDNIIATSLSNQTITALMKIAGAYDTTGYFWSFEKFQLGSTSPSYDGAFPGTSAKLMENIVSSSDNESSLCIKINNPASTARGHVVNYEGTYYSGTPFKYKGGFTNSSAGALTGIRLAMGSCGGS